MGSKRFSASNAGMMMSCHASANLDKAILGWTPPDVDPTAGAKGKGTDLHEIFAKVAELPARDIEHVATALKYLAELRSQRRFQVLIETPARATWLPSSPGTTADLVLFTQDEIHVVDWKTGKIFVDVVENEQMLFYSATYAHLAPKAKGVTAHIVQPWADNIESWFISAPRLKKFMDDAVATDMAITAGSTKFGPSDHCKFCPANPHSRGDKGSPLCPPMLQLLYPSVVDEDEILGL